MPSIHCADFDMERKLWNTPAEVLSTLDFDNSSESSQVEKFLRLFVHLVNDHNYYIEKFMQLIQPRPLRQKTYNRVSNVVAFY